MEIILKLISAFLYFNFVSVVSTYYLFDGKSSDSRYVLPMSGVPYANYGSLHKKRYSGSSNLKYMRGEPLHTGDYQFNLMKTSSHNYGAAQPWNGNDRSLQLITETPTILERPKHEANIIKPPKRDSREESSPKKNPLPNSNVNKPQVSSKSKSVNSDHYKASTKEKPLQPSYEMYKTLEVNVNKKPIVSDPQKNVRNRLASTLSLNSFPNYYRRLQTATNMGMHGHKSEKYTDHNTPALHKMLENMSNKLAPRPNPKPKTFDFRKRDTSGNVIQMYVVPHAMNNDEVLKYTSKEMVKDNIQRADNNSFGGAEVSVVNNDKPYAVFYRMNPAALAGPEEIIMDTMDVNPGANKDAVNINAKIDAIPPYRESIHHGGVKIHKKIKNFSSYKKY